MCRVAVTGRQTVSKDELTATKHSRKRDFSLFLLSCLRTNQSPTKLAKVLQAKLVNIHRHRWFPGLESTSVFGLMASSVDGPFKWSVSGEPKAAAAGW